MPEQLRTIVRMLRIGPVLHVTGLSRAAVYSLVGRGLFPRPRKITERASAWREDEVQAWIDSRPVAQLAVSGERAESEESATKSKSARAVRSRK